MALPASAQGTVEQVIDACVSISNGLKTGSDDKLKSGLGALKSHDVKPFSNLRPMSGETIDLDGHLLFDEEFVDSLIVNRLAMKEARRYAKIRKSRAGGSAKGCRMDTYAIEGGKAVTFKTSARGAKKIAIVGEPDGLFSLRITEKSGKVLYTDTDDVKTGRSVRVADFKLPENAASTILIEVSNRGKLDKSFAIITN